MRARKCAEIPSEHNNSPGFNGAAPVRARKCGRAYHFQQRGIRFNGAAPVRARKSGPYRMVSSGRGSLQRGRACEGAEMMDLLV